MDAHAAVSNLLEGIWSARSITGILGNVRLMNGVGQWPDVLGLVIHGLKELTLQNRSPAWHI